MPASDPTNYSMATDGKGVFKIASVETTSGFNSYRDLFGAFEGIKNKNLLTQHQEYALETLWHEINHNRQIGGEKIKKIDIDDPRRKLMEGVNQLVSRLSYKGFVERLGGVAIHQEWILKNGYGYNNYVKRLLLIFETLEILEAIKGDLFNINFNMELVDIQQHLTDAITKKVDINEETINGILALVVIGLEKTFVKRLNSLRPK